MQFSVQARIEGGDRIVAYLQQTGAAFEHKLEATAVQIGDRLEVFSNGHYTLLLSDASASPKEATVAKGNSVCAPMPCKIAQIAVKSGDVVRKGQMLFVLEAMKMEHVVKAPCDGTVGRVHFRMGDVVPEGKILLDLKQ